LSNVFLKENDRTSQKMKNVIFDCLWNVELELCLL